MNSRRKCIIHQYRGFTLIEILVTIIITAIISVLVMQVIGGHSWRSFWPLQAFGRSMALHETMSDISSNFRRLLMVDNTPLVTLQKNIEDGDYWSGQPFSGSMNAITYCLDFDQTAPQRWEEKKTIDTCNQSDTILKVTLTYESQSLTTLFTR